MTQTTYPYEISLEVAFRDIDAMGFVNNAVFFAYFETVRIKYMGEVMRSGLMGTELLDLPLILVDASCTYKSPALLTEILHIGAGISRFGTKSFDILYLSLIHISTATATHLGLDSLSLADRIDVNDDYLGEGYARVGETEREAITLVGQLEGCLLYTSRCV